MSLYLYGYKGNKRERDREINPFDRNDYVNEVPEKIIAGSHAGWLAENDYSSEDFSLRYVFTDVNGDQTINVDGVRTMVNGVLQWVFEIPSAMSESWPLASPSSQFSWSLMVTVIDSGNTAIVSSGHTSIFKSDADRRTHAELMIEKINSLLEGRAAHDIESYSIKSRSLSRMAPKELLMWRNYYLGELAREGGSETGVRRKNNNAVRIRFV